MRTMGKRASSRLIHAGTGFASLWRATRSRAERVADVVFSGAWVEGASVRGFVGAQIQVPLAVVFFFFNSPFNCTITFYPSPAGATESLPPLGIWPKLPRANPLLEERSSNPDGG